MNLPTQETITQLSEYWRKDPLACTYALFVPKGSRLTKQQEHIIRAALLTPSTFVKSCHGLGKTHTAALTVLTFLFVYTPSVVLTTAPSWQQVKHLLWAEINSIWKNNNLAATGMKLGPAPLETELRLAANWFALGLSPRIEKSDDATKRMTGFHSKHILIVFDEAPAVHPQVWTVKDTLTTTEDPHFLGIGNPVDSSGDFYRGFQDPRNNRFTLDIFESPNFVENGIKSVDDLKRIASMPPKKQEEYLKSLAVPFPMLTTPRWAVERLLKWGENSPLFIARVLSQFPKQASDSLISLADLEACANDKIAPRKGKSVLACDPARFGDDNTAILGIVKWKEELREVYQGQDLMKTANRLIFLANQYNFEVIVVDVVGIGAGIVDRLNEHYDGNPRAPQVIGLGFGESATPEYLDTCDDIVAELFWRLNKLLKGRMLGLNDEGNLYAQLTNRKFIYKHGLMRMEDKDTYKARTGSGSPDEGDALLLAVYGLEMSNRAADIDAPKAKENMGGDW